MSVISVEQAIELLRDDQVVAVPTETVYGLAARISSPVALERIFTTKERPLFDPLIVHVRDIHQARPLARRWPAVIEHLVNVFWPGPLTVVLPKSDMVNSLITSGLDSVGIRAPAHPIAQQILAALDEPFAAPSANRFGRTSPTRAEHVTAEFGGTVPVVDGGPCQVGVESTVIRLQTKNIEVLRPGQITTLHLQEALVTNFSDFTVTSKTSQASPGHLEHHYQPKLPLIIAHTPESAAELHTLAEQYKISMNQIYRLRLSPDATLAARRLYHQLHQFSAFPKGLILYRAGAEWKDPTWAALVDRLTRASTSQIG